MLEEDGAEQASASPTRHTAIIIEPDEGLDAADVHEILLNLKELDPSALASLILVLQTVKNSGSKSESISPISDDDDNPDEGMDALVSFGHESVSAKVNSKNKKTVENTSGPRKMTEDQRMAQVASTRKWHEEDFELSQSFPPPFFDFFENNEHNSNQLKSQGLQRKTNPQWTNSQLIGMAVGIMLVLVGIFGFLNSHGITFLGINDEDGDGYSDSKDAFPNESTQWIDSDGDGFGDNSKGVNADRFPDDPTQWFDSDSDGLSDQMELYLNTDPRDADSDGDTILDGLEIEGGLDPLNSDTDSDGIADNIDIWPKENWVIEIWFSGWETETNEICSSSGSRAMRWTLTTDFGTSTAYGTASASDTVYLDLPDTNDEYTVNITLDGYYYNCPISNQLQMFFGFSGCFQCSDPGSGGNTAATFSFTATPGMSEYSDTEVGGRSTSDFSSTGWLASATITANSMMTSGILV